MTEYRKARPGELTGIVEFIDMVFTGTGVPHEFSSMLPKLYGEGKETERFHYLALEDGEIKAVVCVYPVALHVGDEELICAAVGSVSVHPDSRGKGYMTRLMEIAVEGMKRDGIPISCLTGMRRRYQHFGYEICGWGKIYQVSSAGAAGALAREEDCCFQPLLTVREVTADDDVIWDDLYELYHRQSYRAERSRNDFPDICRSWYVKVCAVLEGDRLAGYLTWKKGIIHELVLDREELLKPVLQAFLLHQKECELSIRVYPHEIQRACILSGCCERESTCMDDNYQIFDYEKVLSCYFKRKSEESLLWDGELTVAIENHGSYCLAVSGGETFVSAADREPEYILTEFEAMSLFFSPAVTEVSRRLQTSHRLNWFPLPLSMCWLDKC